MKPLRLDFVSIVSVLVPMTACAQHEWRAIELAGAPAARSDATTVWTGREVLQWGGLDVGDRYLGDGGAFDPATNTWRTISRQGAPSARAWHTAVWTGREMLVWGGCDADSELGDGAAYDPVSDRWRPLPSCGAPDARGSHVAVFNGACMLVWAGVDENHAFSRGGLLDPVKNTWTPCTFHCGQLTPRSLPGVWTGREFLLWGGINGSSVLGHGISFVPAKRRATLMNATGAPAPRARHAAVWTGRALVVWGGTRSIRGGRPLGDGASYDPVTRRWAALPVAGAPSARFGHAFAWTGTELCIAGGATKPTGDALRDTWVWHPEHGWRHLPDLPAPRAGAHAVATPYGVILLGGRDAKQPCRGGFRAVVSLRRPAVPRTAPAKK
ncbi:MAG: hypothetical protein H6836_04955 [Planctomycetes bacterium]|nr:hypothetical protein [Planctomycetota bacterium]